MAVLVDNDSPRAVRALQDVSTWFEEWEQVLSRFRPESELNRLNAAAGSSQVVSEILWQATQAAMRAARDSDGLVLPNLLIPLEQAGYTITFERLAAHPTPAESAAAVGFAFPAPEALTSVYFEGWQEIILDPTARAVTLPLGMKLDLGGSAKGWAAHQAMLRLRPLGAVLVDAGGDIAVSGALRDGSRWPVAVDDPLRAQDQLALLALDGCGVATSGIDYRRWLRDGSWKHHIIDPRTGQPALTDLISVTVIAPDVMSAEMAAKVLMITGSREAPRWLANRPELRALLVFQDGRMTTMNGFDDYLWREA